MDGLSPSGLSQFKPLKGYEKMENEQTKINVTLGYTLNLGNFQSLRIDLGIIDSRRDGESVEDAFSRVYNFVETKLTEKINESKSEIPE